MTPPSTPANLPPPLAGEGRGEGDARPPTHPQETPHPLLKTFDRTAEAVASLLVVLLLAAVAAGVITRAMGDPLAWTDEAARMLMVWLAMFGWIISTRRRAHVRIRYFQQKLPPTAHRAAEATIQSAMLLLGLVATWFGIDLVQRNLDLEATSLPISIAWLYVPLIPAGIVTALQAAAEAAAQLRAPAP